LKSQQVSFLTFSFISGCDYLPSLKGIGLKKACLAVSDFGAASKAINTWIKWGSHGKIKIQSIPPDYPHALYRAQLAFLYQRVYNPISEKLTTLNELPEGLELENGGSFLGP
jgi:exonuclease 1